MAEPSTPPDSRLVAGKYAVVGLIGRGGMGSVWEGRHATLGTHVAIKFIDQEYAQSLEARSRFVNEARAAATIQSKHAIQIFDHGVTEDGRPYIVMELLVGEPLDKRIDRLGRISLQDTARMLAQVCRALQRAHDAGIIHRDLKPENVFLVRSPDDDDEIAKVLDFGIAKIKGPPGGKALTSSTKTGAVLGTPYYMSPEQARGLRSIDHRSDIWSLGVIAYKCVTGVLPFEGESVGDLLVKICTSPPPTPSSMVPGLPHAFDAWFARALEREPSNRYATASDLADGLLVSAGLSARRAPPLNLLEMQTAFGLPLAAASSPVAPTIVTPVPGASGTAAPFTAPAFASRTRPKTARGVFFAMIAAAVVGGGIGVGGVVKLLSPTSVEPPRMGSQPGATSTSTPSVGRTEAALPAFAGTSTGAIAVTALTASAQRPATRPSATVPTVPALPHPSSRPPAFALPKASDASGPSGAAPSSAPSQSPSSKPRPAFADPGY